MNLEFSALLDLCFQLPRGHHFLDDFPVWDPRFEVPGVMRFEIHDSSQLVASCGIRTANLMVGEHSMPIAILGGVCTHPQMRGQGLASQIISKALDWARKQGAVSVFLWGAETGLYQRQGFSPFGNQARLPLSHVLVALGAGSLNSDATIIEAGLDHELYTVVCGRTDGLSLRPEDWLWYSRHKHVKWYFSRREGHPTAYAAVGRGIDLVGHVHEWGGNSEDLKAVFRAVLADFPEAIWLGHPNRLPQSVDRSQVIQESLCMIKIFNPRQFIDPNQVWLWGLDAA